MLTAKDDQFERNYGLDLGACEYITKPYDSAILLRHVNNVLSKTASNSTGLTSCNMNSLDFCLKDTRKRSKNFNITVFIRLDATKHFNTLQ